MRRWIFLLTVMAAAAVVYRGIVSAYFFEDDFQWLMTTRAFRPEHVLDLGRYAHFYRPVVELYFWAALSLFGGSAALFHLANVAIHAANGVLLFLIVRRITANDRIAFYAALVFVVLPGHVEAVAWVSGVSESLSTLCGCAALYAFLRSDCAPGGARYERVLSWIAFALALLTHESAVVFLPILILLAYTMQGPRGLAAARALAPFVVLTLAYLAIDIPINRRNYVVGEHVYEAGFHIVTNVLAYIVWLYVGKRNAISFAAIAVALVALMAFGNRRVRFATCWMLLALLPFAPFTWGNASRYLYLSAMGFSMLLAEGIESIDRRLLRLPPAYRVAIVAVLVATIAIRFMVFASKGVENFTRRTDAYRAYLRELRRQHPQLAPDSAVALDATLENTLHHRFVQAAVQWEYNDPSLRVVVK